MILTCHFFKWVKHSSHTICQVMLTAQPNIPTFSFLVKSVETSKNSTQIWNSTKSNQRILYPKEDWKNWNIKCK
jgi:hypothetical protein